MLTGLSFIWVWSRVMPQKNQCTPKRVIIVLAWSTVYNYATVQPTCNTRQLFFQFGLLLCQNQHTYRQRFVVVDQHQLLDVWHTASVALHSAVEGKCLMTFSNTLLSSSEGATGNYTEKGSLLSRVHPHHECFLKKSGGSLPGSQSQEDTNVTLRRSFALALVT